MKKSAVWILVGSILLSLTACSVKETSVFVQSVAVLGQMGGIGSVDRFGGIVVSESVTEIKKDDDKNIDTLYVKEGNDVVEGQELFSYDTEQLQLTLDKQRLQLEQLQASIENYKDQIAQLEKDREKASAKDKLQYTVQIQTNQIDLKEAELNVVTKQSEVMKSELLLENAVVLSPVTGRVTSINESGTDDYGKPLAFITIQKTGSFRIKGTINEMQRGAVMEGNNICIESRIDPSQVWFGTVSLVDYENPVQGNNNGFYSNSDEMGSSSRYPFYVELETSDGLLLGQHVYLSVTSEEEEYAGLMIDTSFICYDDSGVSYVWADNGQGKLEKRTVELGGYDGMRDAYEIIDGLDEKDYIAFPDEDLCKEGAPTNKVQSGREGGVS